MVAACGLYSSVGFEALTAVVMKITIFWDITERSPLNVNRRFRGTYCLHHQGRRISRARSQSESRYWSVYHMLSRWFLARLILRPWRWRRYVPTNRRLTFNRLHGIMSQKMVLLWIHVAQDGDEWRPLVNMLWIFRFHTRQWIYWLLERLSASRGLCFMESVC
jgi:hypothetical protein